MDLAIQRKLADQLLHLLGSRARDSRDLADALAVTQLGELISLARELKGWTLRDLEEVCGLSNALISQVETGKIKNPGIYTVQKIADALGISPERLFATIRPIKKPPGSPGA